MIKKKELKEKYLEGLATGHTSLELINRYGISSKTAHLWDLEYHVKTFFGKKDKKKIEQPSQKQVVEEPKIKEVTEELPIVHKEEQEKSFVQKDDYFVIKELKHNNQYEEALAICKKEENLKKGFIQLQRIRILCLLDRYEEALDVCDAAKELDNHAIYEMRKKVLYHLNPNTNKNVEIKKLLTKIYIGNIRLNEIEESICGPWKKDVLRIAYYHKQNKSAALFYIKQLKEEPTLEEWKRKKLNYLTNVVLTKKGLGFDISKYADILGCQIDFEAIDSLTKEKIPEKEEFSVIKEEKTYFVNPTKEKKEKKERNYVSSVGQTVGRITRQTDEKNIVQKPKESPLLIQDIFKEEVFFIKKYLYVEMNKAERQKEAIDAWDRFEVLIAKRANDQEALKRMVELLIRISYKAKQEEYTKQLQKKYEHLFK